MIRDQVEHVDLFGLFWLDNLILLFASFLSTQHGSCYYLRAFYIQNLG